MGRKRVSFVGSSTVEPVEKGKALIKFKCVR